jgi:hypothetical protein
MPGRPSWVQIVAANPVLGARSKSIFKARIWDREEPRPAQLAFIKSARAADIALDEH